MVYYTGYVWLNNDESLKYANTYARYTTVQNSVAFTDRRWVYVRNIAKQR